MDGIEWMWGLLHTCTCKRSSGMLILSPRPLENSSALETVARKRKQLRAAHDGAARPTDLPSINFGPFVVCRARFGQGSGRASGHVVHCGDTFAITPPHSQYPSHVY